MAKQVDHDKGVNDWYAEEAERLAALGRAAQRFGYEIDTEEGEPPELDEDGNVVGEDEDYDVLLTKPGNEGEDES